MTFTKDFIKGYIRSALPEVASEMLDVALVGSTHIHGTGNDIDMLVLVDRPSHSQSLVIRFNHPDWKYGGSTPKSGDQWCSWKNGEINLLLTDNPVYFAAWVAAADVCRLLAMRGILKPEDKNMRVAVHRVVMDKYTAEAALALCPDE